MHTPATVGKFMWPIIKHCHKINSRSSHAPDLDFQVFTFSWNLGSSWRTSATTTVLKKKSPDRTSINQTEDGVYLVCQSLMTLLIWGNTEHTRLFLKGSGYFFVTARLLLLFCYYGMHVYTQCNWCYRNPLQFPTQCLPAYAQNGTDIIMDLSNAIEIDFIAF